MNGQGTKKDPAKAAEWFTKAAEKGDRNARKILGAMYLQGTGVATDMDKARYWLQKAADQGDMDAKNLLSELN